MILCSFSHFRLKAGSVQNAQRQSATWKIFYLSYQTKDIGKLKDVPKIIRKTELYSETQNF